MLFQTVSFGVLFLGTCAAFYLGPKRHRLAVLAAGCLLFYGASGLLDFLLLLSVLVISYQLSLRVRPGGSRVPLILGILLLLGSLAYFKYGGFIYEVANVILGLIDLPSLPRFSQTLLPLGISFYTFQIVAYLVDLHAGRTQPTRRFLHYLVFIMFFGQLIAGPIMRASEYLHQLTNLPGASIENLRAGMILILVGLFKKVVLADNLARLVDVRFDSVEPLTQADAWIAAYLFAFQIFLDFSGYVSIGLGLALMFGITLRENFRTPYLSGSPREFWSRWHITLSQWFRDYLYIPLGGNRNGRVREIVNLMAVMTIAGLWHGAGWTFIIWGMAHGAMLCASRFIPSAKLESLLPLPVSIRGHAYQVLGIVVFFHLTVLAWIPFRAPDLATTVAMLTRALTFEGFNVWMNQLELVLLVGVLFGLHGLERLVSEHHVLRSRVASLIPRPAYGVGLAAIVLLIILNSGAERHFIYFRF